MKSLLSIFLSLLFFSSNAQTIAEIQGSGDVSPYADEIVTTTGVVTAVGSVGYFIQDGVAIRSGIYVYDQDNNPSVGDEITLTAEVTEFFELTELKTVTSLMVNSTGNTLPAPIILTTSAANNEDYEGMLIQIDAVCTDTDIGFGEWEANDGSGTLSVDDLLFLSAPTLNVSYIVTGPLHYSFDKYKIEPREAADVQIGIPLYFTQNPEELEIATTQITMYWETNIPANSQIKYGLTPAYELGTLSDANLDTDHEIILDNLSPATLYYLEITSEEGGDITPAQKMVVSTASNSSGTIAVYFNHPVNPTVATVSEATYTDDITGTIISYLDQAEQSLDITIYEAQSSEIIAAINAAYDRGVQVRVISDDEGDNDIFSELNTNIPILEGNAGGLMHNKFTIIDVDDVDNCWVMTGSTNHTVANLGWDYNNLICIQDQSLARGYTQEFNEMWGGSAAQPDLNNSRFGSDKTDNTPHRFVIDGIEVESYFSPSDGVSSRIVEAIDEAEDELAFAILVFTENSLGNAVVAAHDRGVEVKGIIDYVEFNGSELANLQNEGVDVIDYQNADGSQWPDGPTLHHKYAIIDYSSTSENPLVITGSHNWTASAGSVHDENTLLIYDAEVSNWYYQEFHARFFGLTDAVKEISEIPLAVSPNPTKGDLDLTLPTNGTITLFDTKGKALWQKEVQEGNQQLSLPEIPAGVYTLLFTGENENRVARIIKP